MDEIKKIEILYDHYKDTFENIKLYINKRNKYTFILLIILSIFLLQLSNPDLVCEFINGYLKKNIDANSSFDSKYLNIIIDFGLLIISIMYFQINFTIEKNYNYIHQVEKELCKWLHPLKIQREGFNYLKSYPLLSCIIHRIYIILIPFFLIFITIYKFYNEIQDLSRILSDNHILIDIILLSSISLSSFLYFINRNFSDFRKLKLILKKMKRKKFFFQRIRNERK